MIRTGQADVAIVGGGLMGCAAAIALRRRGRSVVLLEQGWCGAQASGVNYGGVRRQGRALVQLPLAQRAQAIWQDLAAMLESDIEYVRSGHLKLAGNAVDMDELCVYRDRVAPYGLALQVLSRDEVRRRYPCFSDQVAGASLSPDDGQANPRLLAAAYARAARRAGVVVHEHSAVQMARVAQGHFELETVTGVQVIAQQLVNCAGAWGAQLAAWFGETVPIGHLHPNMLVTEPLPPLFAINIGVVGGGFYARQVARGNVVIGGGRTTGQLSLSGNRPSCDASRRALTQATRFVPAISQAMIIRSWTGVEGDTPDRQPILGSSMTTPGLHHGFGFSGAGFQVAPAVGEVLAELVCDGRSATPIAAFRIDRFESADVSARVD
jgi:sarcosine oxidase subunit beta